MSIKSNTKIVYKFFSLQEMDLRVKTIKIIVTVYISYAFFGPFLLNQVSFANKLVYSFLFAVNYGMAYYFVNVLLGNNIRKSLSRYGYMIYSFVLCVLAFFLIVVTTYIIKKMFFIEYLHESIVLNEEFIINILLEVSIVTLYLHFYIWSVYMFIQNYSNNTKSEFIASEDLITTSNYNINTVSQTDDDLIIYGKNKDEFRKLSMDDFVYAKSEGHYLKVFYHESVSDLAKSADIQWFIIRNSMKNLKEMMRSHDNIIRIHKSYLINTHKIKYATPGLNNGGHITIILNNIKIPFSNILEKPFLDKIKLLK